MAILPFIVVRENSIMNSLKIEEKREGEKGRAFNTTAALFMFWLRTFTHLLKILKSFLIFFHDSRMYFLSEGSTRR